MMQALVRLDNSSSSSSLSSLNKDSKAILFLDPRRAQDSLVRSVSISLVLFDVSLTRVRP
jgi:hypothetical protein